MNHVSAADFSGDPGPFRPYTPYRTGQSTFAFQTSWDSRGSAAKAAEVRHILRARRLRSDHLPSSFFSDPAWDILLELFACHLEQVSITISAVFEVNGIPITTGLRWTNTLMRSGLILRRPDKLDRRRIFLELTDQGRTSMNEYFRSAGSGAVAL